MTRRVLVCGGRDYADEAALFAFLDAEHELCPIVALINGGAPGADALARRWAMNRGGVICTTVGADWRRYGKSAGPRRNWQMLTEQKPDVVVAFPRANGKFGTGTAHMISIARKAGVRVIEVTSSQDSPMGSPDTRALHVRVKALANRFDAMALGAEKRAQSSLQDAANARRDAQTLHDAAAKLERIA